MKYHSVKKDKAFFVFLGIEERGFVYWNAIDMRLEGSHLRVSRSDAIANRLPVGTMAKSRSSEAVVVAVIELRIRFLYADQRASNHKIRDNRSIWKRISMFKKFDPSSDVSTSTQVKKSVERTIKSKLLEKHPNITEELLEELLPKKSPLVQYKVGPHLMLYCRRVEHEDRTPTDEPVLFQHRDGPILPTLKLVHQYPTLEFRSATVDKGAIPFILGGANIMCPGLTNPGSEMPQDSDDAPGLEKGDGVVIYAEGKEYAIAVAVMTMSSADV